MRSWKKRFLSALCAAMMVLSLAACGGDNSDPAADGGSSAADAADGGSSAAEPAMSETDYLASVEGLNNAATEFAAATAEFVAAGLSNPDDESALNESIDKIRATKQSFLDFAAIANPAEGYEDAHTALAKDCTDFASLVDEYCDILLGGISGEVDPNNTDIQTRMQEVVTSLGNSLNTITEIAAAE